jgi:1-acyl-sn-glycerol-3-phosphate acyltransferase
MDTAPEKWTDLMGMGRDPWPRIWIRRAITIPLYFVCWALLLGSIPVLLPLAAVLDLARRSRFALVRMLAFLLLYFTFEAVGIVASLLLWLIGGPWISSNVERYLRWNFWLQCGWARVLAGGAFKIFSLRLDVEGQEDYRGRPLLLFTRHVSTADTVLPALLIAIPQGVILRYVIKRELLADPCLDIVGNRLPNCFVRRGSGDTRRELRAIERLMQDLRPGHGILMYPEGTRFTGRKRERVLRRLEESGDRQALERALSMPLVLPPRLAGSLALLENNPGADAVFCIHTGFESTMSMAQLWRGDLVGGRVRVSFWRVPYESIPRGREALSDWMWDQWEKVNASLQKWRDTPIHSPEG